VSLEIGSSVRGLVALAPLSIGHKSSPSGCGRPARRARASAGASPARPQKVTYQSASIA